MPAGLRAIQRRHRRGVFTPLQLPGLIGWYDAPSIIGLNDNDPIDTWSDLSGVGNHITGVTTQRPLYKVVSGQPLVRFDGVDDYLTKAALLASATAFTVISVVRTIGAGEANGRIWCLGSTGNDYNLFVNGSHPTASFGYFRNEAGGVTDLGGDTETLSVVTVRATSLSALDTYINGAANVTLDPGPSAGGTGSGNFFLSATAAGGTSDANAEHLSHLIFNVSLSDGNRQRAERFLGARFGVAVA